VHVFQAVHPGRVRDDRIALNIGGGRPPAKTRSHWIRRRFVRSGRRSERKSRPRLRIPTDSDFPLDTGAIRTEWEAFRNEMTAMTSNTTPGSGSVGDFQAIRTEWNTFRQDFVNPDKLQEKLKRMEKYHALQQETLGQEGRDGENEKGT